MTTRNPYTIGFGKIPSKYFSRDILIDSIIEEFDSEDPDEQAFKITGIRGTGKTVILSDIERRLRKDKNWIVVGLRPDSDIIGRLVAELYDSVPMLAEFIDLNLNLSAFGIGLEIQKNKPVADLSYALKLILKHLKKKKKRLLVTIDEARRTKGIVEFIQEFQILIREELPVFFLAAGLYEDIESLENSKGLTFFLRATKYEMTPLNAVYIRDDYKKTLNIAEDEAEKMAQLTKGYAFAYQVLGKYMWDLKEKHLTDEVLRKFDEALSEKVYRKIWSELTEKDRWFLGFISKKDKIPACELLEITKQSHSSWSVPRARLKEKGIINVEKRGMIELCLPRFREFIENYALMIS